MQLRCFICCDILKHSSCLCSRVIFAFLGCSVITDLPAVWEARQTWVPSRGQRIPWRRNWQSTPVFSPGEILWTEEPGGHSPQGHKGWDTTEHGHFCITVYHAPWCGGIVLRCLIPVRALTESSFPSQGLSILIFDLCFPHSTALINVSPNPIACASFMSCKSVSTTSKFLSLIHILLTLLFTSVFVPIIYILLWNVTFP